MKSIKGNPARPRSRRAKRAVTASDDKFTHYVSDVEVELTPDVRHILEWTMSRGTWTPAEFEAELSAYRAAHKAGD